MDKDALKYLIEGCRRGEARAQKQLFLYLYDYGMNIAVRYAHTTAEAEDIANEAFYKLLSGIDKYPEQVPIKSWLRRIVINCGIDHYRKRKVRKEAIVKVHPAIIRNQGEERLDQEYLLDLVRQLPPQYRIVFVLHVIEGYDHQEIANQLGISRGTSKSNLAKARKKLQTMIEEHNQAIARYGR